MCSNGYAKMRTWRCGKTMEDGEEKVNTRLRCWEKMLGRLAKRSSPDVFSNKKEGPDAALEICSFHLGRSQTALDYH